jgi:hypothetical protein
MDVPVSRPANLPVPVVIDCGRSQIKIMPATSQCVLTVESLIAKVPSLPFGEMGAFTLCRQENSEEVIEHWVVGRSAKLQESWIAMSEDSENKIKYFPILALGAISSLPDLYSLSRGSGRRRRLLIDLITLSLANPLSLRSSLDDCLWIEVEGIKYSLSFRGNLSFPEGYGAALWGRLKRPEASSIFTFDVGYGTACFSQYLNLGILPKRVAHEPNGGGGVSQLVSEFARTTAEIDSCRLIKPSQLKEILESSSIGSNSKITAVTPDGRDIGNCLEKAIKNWIKDSPLSFALESVALCGRKYPIVLCGGGFAVEPIRFFLKEAILSRGVPAENLVETPDPATIALSQIKEMFLKYDEERYEQKKKTPELGHTS